MVSRMEWRVVDINYEIDYDGPGVYKIQLVDKNGKLLEIRRFGGTDEEGVAVIGCSEQINTRRKQFVTSSAGERGHSGGIQWWLVKYFLEWAKQTSLRFAFAELGTKEEAMRVEMEEIQDYFTKHLEAPPLKG